VRTLLPGRQQGHLNADPSLLESGAKYEIARALPEPQAPPAIKPLQLPAAA
jgi:hypothetical protein